MLVSSDTITTIILISEPTSCCTWRKAYQYLWALLCEPSTLVLEEGEEMQEIEGEDENEEEFQDSDGSI